MMLIVDAELKSSSLASPRVLFFLFFFVGFFFWIFWFALCGVHTKLKFDGQIGSKNVGESSNLFSALIYSILQTSPVH